MEMIKSITKAFLVVFFLLTLIHCDSSTETKEDEVKTPIDITSGNQNPEGEEDEEEEETKNPVTPPAVTSGNNDNTPNVFENKDCNRFYWTFKCALEYKKSKAHSEECKKNIVAVYPDDKDSLARISAQSRNSEQTIKATWANYFENNCKEDVSVTENLKELN